MAEQNKLTHQDEVIKEILDDTFSIFRNPRMVITSFFSGNRAELRKNVENEIVPILEGLPVEFVDNHKAKIKKDTRTLVGNRWAYVKDKKNPDLGNLQTALLVEYENSDEFRKHNYQDVIDSINAKIIDVDGKGDDVVPCVPLRSMELRCKIFEEARRKVNSEGGNPKDACSNVIKNLLNNGSNDPSLTLAVSMINGEDRWGLVYKTDKIMDNYEVSSLLPERGVDVYDRRNKAAAPTKKSLWSSIVSAFGRGEPSKKQAKAQLKSNAFADAALGSDKPEDAKKSHVSFTELRNAGGIDQGVKKLISPSAGNGNIVPKVNTSKVKEEIIL